MERCPNCQARTTGIAQCQRCDMDLSWLLDIEVHARALAIGAIAQLAGNDLKGAEQSLAEAVHLYGAPVERSLLGFVKFLQAMKLR